MERGRAGEDPGNGNLRRELGRLDDRIDQLQAELSRLALRLDGLEGEPEGRVAEQEEVAEIPAPAAPVMQATPSNHGVAPSQEWIPLVGRSLIVLAGAFVLRALTEGGLLPRGLGVGAGCIYALAWLVAVDLSGAKERRLSAAFHGLTASVIALPLIWEATVQFRIFSATQGLVVLSFFCAMALFVADRRRLVSLAATALLGGFAVQVATAFSLASWTECLSFAAAAGLAAELLAARRGWVVLAGTLAAGVDLLFAFVTLAFLLADPDRAASVIAPGPLVASLVVLVLVYLVPTSLRAVGGEGQVRPGEFFQAMVATAIGLGGAAGVSRLADTWRMGVGCFALGAALTLYALSFFFADRRVGRRSQFIFFSILALIFAGAALPVLFSREMVAGSFCLVALLTSWLGARFSRATLSFHAALYCAGAVLASGLAASTWAAWIGSPPGAVTPLMLAAFAVSGVCAWMRVAWHGRTWGRFSRLPKVLLVALTAFAGGGLLLIMISRLWPAAAKGGIVGTSLPTVVLSLAAMALAELSRGRRLGEARWLVYPVLGLGALRLLLVDLRTGSPLAAVAPLIVLGTALIVTSLRLRRPASADQDPARQDDARPRQDGP